VAGTTPEPAPRRRLTSSPGIRTGRRLETLETAIQQVAEGVVIADRNGTFLFWNEAARRMVGTGPLALPPSEWSAAFGCFLPDEVTPYPPDELPLVKAIRGEPVLEAEMFIRSPANPEGTWISINSAPLRDEKGEPSGGVVVFRDVTAHRRSREVVQQLSKALERTTDAVFITDRNAVIEYVNPAFEAVTGYSQEQAVGQRASILKSGRSAPGYYERLWQRILAGDVHSGTLVNRKRNGELFHAEQTITPLSDETGRITSFVSVMRDVTEIRKAEEREVEMRLARVVQQRLYPPRAPQLEGFDLAGAAFAADQTCGDYYDFIPFAGDRVAIAVGDVSGHGFGSALLMVETRAYLRSLSKTSSDLGQILLRLNRLLCQDTDDERFVTMLATLLDPVRKSLVYSSAGHVDGYVLDRGGATRHVLGSTGLPLGILAEAEFPPSAEIPLAAGDLLLLLTDGATEAQDPDGAFFETERVLRVVAEERHRGAAQIVECLQAAVREFSRDAPQADDITAVVCKVGP
jgi:sigma-B regulation protein RsbU (phosphoserine phosphatase)